jgi:hypothetical protein
VLLEQACARASAGAMEVNAGYPGMIGCVPTVALARSIVR